MLSFVSFCVSCPCLFVLYVSCCRMLALRANSRAGRSTLRSSCMVFRAILAMQSLAGWKIPAGRSFHSYFGQGASIGDGLAACAAGPHGARFVQAKDPHTRLERVLNAFVFMPLMPILRAAGESARCRSRALDVRAAARRAEREARSSVSAGTLPASCLPAFCQSACFSDDIMPSSAPCCLVGRRFSSFQAFATFVQRPCAMMGGSFKGGRMRAPGMRLPAQSAGRSKRFMCCKRRSKAFFAAVSVTPSSLCVPFVDCDDASRPLLLPAEALSFPRQPQASCKLLCPGGAAWSTPT